VEAKMRKVLGTGELVKKAELAKRMQDTDISESAAYRWMATFVDERILLLHGRDEYSLNPSLILGAL
jgi:DNA-binding IclR family transcriptional regulator